MKKNLVAVLGALCLPTLASAAVITIETTMAMQGEHYPWVGPPTMERRAVAHNTMWIGKFDLSTMIVPAGEEVTSAVFRNAFSSPTTVTLGQLTVDPLIAETGDATHNALIGTEYGGTTSAPVYLSPQSAVNVTAPTGVVGTVWESIDVTPIVQAWAAGAANYGFGMTSTTEGTIFMDMAQLIITTAIPEPASAGLATLGIGTLLLRRRRA